MQTYEPLVETLRVLPNQLFGAFVERRRMQLRMTSSEAADLAGLPFSIWVSIETGWHSELSDEVVFSVARTLEVTADLIRWMSAIND
jgi:hypothetical protein